LSGCTTGIGVWPHRGIARGDLRATNGHYEYLGVRLSDAAVLRTNADRFSTWLFAQRAGVRYVVSRAELKVTAGSTVVKREPMIEYREIPAATKRSAGP
jgi:hypothetical protein